LTAWAAFWLVPVMMDPPTTLQDGFPPGPILAMWAIVSLPISLATSFAMLFLGRRTR
jgi:hypothetical protein